MRFKWNPTDNSSILTESRLDSVIISIISSFQYNVGIGKIDDHIRNGENLNNTRKGVKVPNESSRIFEKLLATESGKLLNVIMSAFQSYF